MVLVTMDLRWDTSAEAVEFPICLIKPGVIKMGKVVETKTGGDKVAWCA